MSTIYRVDRVVLDGRRLTCRHGLVFVGMRDRSAWHAVIYDVAFGPLGSDEGEGPMTFSAATSDGLRLQGMAQLGCTDAETRMLYIAGVGLLRRGDQTTAALEYVAPGDDDTKAQDHP